MMQLWETTSDKPKPVWRGHTDSVTGVVFSPDGQRIASCSCDKTVKLWDAQTRMVISIFNGHSSFVQSVAFSPNGAQLASGGEDGTVRIWDVKSIGLNLGALETPDKVKSVAYSPDGRSLITGSSSAVRKYNADTGEPELVLSVGRVLAECIAYSADGHRFATGGFSDAVVKIWNAETGVVDLKLIEHTKAITSVTFSPCGGCIATSSEDKTIRVWEAHLGDPCRVLAGHTEGVADVSFSPCGQWIASGSSEGDGSIRIWDMGAEQSRVLVRMQTQTFKSVVYSPSGRQIAGRGEREFESLTDEKLELPVVDGISIWDAQTGELQHTLQPDDDVHCFAFSSCGYWIASGCFSRRHGHSVCVFYSGKNNMPQKWRRLSVVRGFFHQVTSVAWRPERLEFVTGCEDGSTRVWKVMLYTYTWDTSDASDALDALSANVEQVWSTGLTLLSVVEAAFLDTLDLSSINRELLKQQGGASDEHFYGYCGSDDSGYDPDDLDDMDDSDNSDD